MTTIIGISSRLLGNSRHAAGRRSATADARAERQGQKIAHLDTPGLTSPFNGSAHHRVVRASGRVARSYADGDGVFIKLEKPDVEPKDGYFRLNQSTANYHAMYSLALAAAINRYTLQIRTKSIISTGAQEEDQRL